MLFPLITGIYSIIFKITLKSRADKDLKLIIKNTLKPSVEMNFSSVPPILELLHEKSPHRPVEILQKDERMENLTKDVLEATNE